MPYTRSWSQPRVSYYTSGFILLLLSAWTYAAEITYCSPDNDASNNFLTSIYMSDGKCQDNCKGSYAFAVLLGQSCWCTNYIPANQESTSLCSDSCPGFPTDKCGNAALGLYGYYSVGGTPSGTAGASSASPSSSNSPPPPVSTIVPTTTGYTSEPIRSTRSFPASAFSFSVDVSLLTPYVSSQSSAESSSTLLTTSTSSSSSSPSSSASPSSEPASVYTSVMTVTGQATTVIITPTSTARATDSALGASSQSSSSGSSGISGGTVAGIVVGVAIIIGLLIGGAVFYWLRRKHRKNLDAISEGAGSYASPSHASKGNGGVPSRQVSQMSSAGLLAKPTRMNTTGHSSNDEARTIGMSSDRTSTHMTVDQRLNPWAIYSTEVHRSSNVSLQDNQDYSRQLRVANPDP